MGVSVKMPFPIVRVVIMVVGCRELLELGFLVGQFSGTFGTGSEGDLGWSVALLGHFLEQVDGGSAVFRDGGEHGAGAGTLQVATFFQRCSCR
jgi:hypothetical protein